MLGCQFILDMAGLVLVSNANDIVLQLRSVRSAPPAPKRALRMSKTSTLRHVVESPPRIY